MKNNLIVLGVVLLIVIGLTSLYVAKKQRSTMTPSVTNEQPTGTSAGSAPNTTMPSSQTAAQANQVEPTVQEIPLSITEPASKTTTSSSITIKGQTLPNADVAVDDKSVKADSQGNFSAPVTLDEGDNSIIVVANDANGNYAEKEIIITYNTGTTYAQ